MFPIGTAVTNSRWLAGLVAGSSLMGSLPAIAADWDGSASQDWNTPANWSGDAVPAGQNVFINDVSVNIPKISANIAATPVDILIGNGAGTVGRLDHTAGQASTGGGNWMLVGRQDGGDGTYNLADTSAAGGTLTGFGLGSGSMAVSGRLYVGGANYGGSIGTGKVNVNTSGTLSSNDLAVGSAGGTGVMNVDAGTITTGGWNFIGKNEATTGANGTLNMSGGTLSNTGRTYVGQAGCTGVLNLSGGSYRNVNNEVFMAGEGAGSDGTVSITNANSLLQSGGELWLGQAGGTGKMVLSAGSVTVNNWVAVGRDGGTGSLDMSGGSITKTGGGNFIIGASGPGTLTQTGGLVDVQSGITWLAENNSAIATMTLSGTAEYRTSSLVIGVNGGTNGTLNLNGGTLKAGQITGGSGTETVSFNGTQIVASSSQTTFLNALDTATIDAGGLLVDTAGFNSIAPQVLGGEGGVTKSGLGTLALLGANTYTGPTAVNAGKLILSTDNANGGNVVVANGATFGVVQTLQDSTLAKTDVTLGATGPSTIELDLGNFAGNTANELLNVSGTLRLNGTVTVNLLDQLPEVGTAIPLIRYTAKAGTGAFVLGSLPNGVVASLNDNGAGLVSLTITSVALPYWDGTVDNEWTTSTTVKNWINLVGGAASGFANGNPALFNDSAAGVGGTSVSIPGTVIPSGVTVDTSVLEYSFSGAGKISGTGGLTKTGTSNLTIETANDYTGVTRLGGGITSVPTLSNGGSASPLGAAPANPANLVLGDGTLDYTGPSTTTDRSLTLDGGAGIRNTNDLTLSGIIATSTGRLVKTGAGNLILTNTGSSALGQNGRVSRVDEGTLTLNGGTYTIGELWTGTTVDVPSNVVLNNATLTMNTWIAIGRGNGASGTLSTFSATNSTMITSNLSTGYDAGRANDSDQTLTIHNTNWTNNGATLIAESANATTDMVVSGTSVVQLNDRFLMGLGTDAVANLTIQDSGSLTKSGGWLAIGNSNSGIATATVRNSGRLTADGDFNIGDVGTSSGTLNVQDNAVVTSNGILFVGKNGGTTGTIQQTGGTINSNNWVTVGRFNGGTGTLNVSGGTFNQTGAGQNLIIGEEGTGNLTVSGTGVVNSAGNLIISNGGTAVAVVNLNAGGTITTRQVAEGAGGAGNATLNFDGGVLKAGTGANANFLNGLDNAFVLAGGVNLDTNGNDINVAQSLLDTSTSAGLTKTGAGRLGLDGANTYTGTTLVSMGTLGGNGSVAGPLTVSAGTTVNPGATAAAGTLTAGATTIAGTYACDLDGAAADQLIVNGALNVSAATLVVNTLPGGVGRTVYIIATYTGSTPAPFASTGGLPAGYTVNYAYNNGVSSTNVAIVAPVTPFSTWASSFYPGETDLSIVGPTADPDGDGQANSLEFALGGAPNHGSNNAKTAWFAADSSDAGSDKELLMTIAVRTGTPAFVGSPSPSAAKDGFTMTVEGSTGLESFPTIVDAVTPVITDLPAAPAGYEYRSFSLRGSNGLPTRGYLRVRVAP